MVLWGVCKNFDQRVLQVKMIRKLEIPLYKAVELDDFHLSLHKITGFQLLLLIYSAYVDINRGNVKITFSSFFCIVV